MKEYVLENAQEIPQYVIRQAGPRSLDQVGENTAFENPPGGSEKIKRQGGQAIPEHFSKSIAQGPIKTVKTIEPKGLRPAGKGTVEDGLGEARRRNPACEEKTVDRKSRRGGHWSIGFDRGGSRARLPPSPRRWRYRLAVRLLRKKARAVFLSARRHARLHQGGHRFHAAGECLRWKPDRDTGCFSRFAKDAGSLSRQAPTFRASCFGREARDAGGLRRLGRKIHVWQDLPGHSSHNGSNRRRWPDDKDLAQCEGRWPCRGGACGSARLVICRLHSLKINHVTVKSPPQIWPSGAHFRSARECRCRTVPVIIPRTRTTTRIITAGPPLAARRRTVPRCRRRTCNRAIPLCMPANRSGLVRWHSGS